MLNKFLWLKPIADSFSLQMNMLGLFQHALRMKQGTGSSQVYNLTLERQRQLPGPRQQRDKNTFRIGYIIVAI